MYVIFLYLDYSYKHNHTRYMYTVSILYFCISIFHKSRKHQQSEYIFYTHNNVHKYPRLTTTEMIRRRSFRFQRPIPSVKLICRQTAAKVEGRVFLENRSERRTVRRRRNRRACQFFFFPFRN